MKSKAIKYLATIFFSLVATIPAFANTTSITITATVNDFVVLQLERDSDNKILSSDNMDPLPGSPLTNESLSFGMVNALGVTPSPAGSINGTDLSSLSVKLVDTSYKLFDVNTPPPTGTKNGAVYYLSGKILLKALRSNSATMKVAVSNDSSSFFPVIVAKKDEINWSVNNAGNISAKRILPNTGFITLEDNMENNSAQALDLGIHVQYGALPGNHSSLIVFCST